MFTPQKKIKYLGFISEYDLEAFYLPNDKQTNLFDLLTWILSKSSVSVLTLQCLSGKCPFFPRVNSGLELGTRVEDSSRELS